MLQLKKINLMWAVVFAKAWSAAAYVQVRVQKEGLNNVTDTVNGVYLMCIVQRDCVFTDVRDYSYLCLYTGSFKVLRSFHKCTMIPSQFYLGDLTLDFPKIFDSLHTQTCTRTHTIPTLQQHPTRKKYGFDTLMSWDLLCWIRNL